MLRLHCQFDSSVAYVSQSSNFAVVPLAWSLTVTAVIAMGQAMCHPVDVGPLSALLEFSDLHASFFSPTVGNSSRSSQSSSDGSMKSSILV